MPLLFSKQAFLKDESLQSLGEYAINNRKPERGFAVFSAQGFLPTRGPPSQPASQSSLWKCGSQRPDWLAPGPGCYGPSRPVLGLFFQNYFLIAFLFFSLFFSCLFYSFSCLPSFLSFCLLFLRFFKSAKEAPCIFLKNTFTHNDDVGDLLRIEFNV